MLGTLAAGALARRLLAKMRCRYCCCCLSPCRGSLPAWHSLTAFKAVGLEPGLLTIVVGHATFCVVVVFNNVIARFRRTVEARASMDLGATGWQTCCVVLPNLKSALLAGEWHSLCRLMKYRYHFASGHERTLPLWLLNQPRAYARCARHQRCRAVGAGNDDTNLRAWWLTATAITTPETEIKPKQDNAMQHNLLINGKLVAGEEGSGI